MIKKIITAKGSASEAWHFLPLLLPARGSRLLSLGCDLELLGHLTPFWEDIAIYVPQHRRHALIQTIRSFPPNKRLKLRIAENLQGLDPEAILIHGLGPYGWKKELPIEISCWLTRPFVALGREAIARNWSFETDSQLWRLTGFPSLLAAPRCWIPSSSLSLPTDLFSPRGRLERHRVSLEFYLRKSGLFGWPYVIVTNSERSKLKAILHRALEDSVQDPGNLWYVTKNNVLLIFLANIATPLVIKIPLTPNACIQMAKHYRRLSHITHRYADEPIGNLLPRARILSLDDCQFGVESIVSGRPAFQFIWSRRTLTKIQAEACRILADWQQRHCLTASLDEALFLQHIEKPLAALQAALYNQGKAGLFDRYLRVLKSKLLNQKIPLVPVHGDFWLNNVLWDEKDGRVRGILDWDESMDQGLPLLDVFHLLYWRTSSLYDLHSRWVLFFSLNKRFPGYKGRLIREYCARLSIEKDLIPWLFVRYWLGEASKKLEGLFESRETLAAFAYLDELIKDFQ